MLETVVRPVRRDVLPGAGRLLQALVLGAVDHVLVAAVDLTQVDVILDAKDLVIINAPDV